MIECRLLGPVCITLESGGPPPPQLRWRKHVALLVYLARASTRGRSREHLLGLLWPEKPEQKARHSLNVALTAIAGAWGKAASRPRSTRFGSRPLRFALTRTGSKRWRLRATGGGRRRS